MSYNLELKSSNKCYGGEVRKYSFQSKALGDLTANFNIFLPPSAVGSKASKVPILYYLAGLTCTEDNGAQKGNFHERAAKEEIAVVFPDTSPRGAKIEGEDESYDFGSGAGFYLNATKSPWNKHYNMYDHVVKELPDVLKQGKFPVIIEKASICGHSMGGMALVLYLRNPDLYKSASAFAPICHPTQCAWGKKAFEGYFEGGLEEGKKHDATELLKQVGGPSKRELHILIDSGLGDNFYKEKQLLPEDFANAAMEAGYKDEDISIRLQDGYDHSYFFISTFVPEHISFHAKYLK